MCSMILQLRREEDNMCGYRGLLLNSEQQTFSFIVPKNLRYPLNYASPLKNNNMDFFRILYDKLIAPIQDTNNLRPENHKKDIDFDTKIYENNLEKIASAYFNLNRFLCAFIDHVSGANLMHCGDCLPRAPTI